MKTASGTLWILRIGLLLAWAGGASADRDWVRLRPERARRGAAVRATRAAKGTWTWQVDCGGIEARVAETAKGRYTQLKLDGAGSTTAVGRPRLPVIRRLLSAPEGARVSVSFRGTPRVLSLRERGLDHPLWPRQAPVPKRPGAREKAEFRIDPRAYAVERFGPEEVVSATEIGRLRGRRLLLIEIRPAAYHPGRRALRHYDSLTLTLRCRPAKDAAGTELQLLSSEPAGDGTSPASAGKSAPGRLLIVGHDTLAGHLAGYVAHKQALGWTVDVADTSTAGGTAEAIRSWIRARYDEPALRPDAVLLVGDVEQVPRFGSGIETDPSTDLYYGCLDGGDDWIPELPVGRFSVGTTGELAAVVQKTIGFETAGEDAWMYRAVLMAGMDYSWVTEATHDWVIENHLAPLGYDADRLYEDTYGAGTPDVTDAFNDGRVLGVYSGHGSEWSWADGPEFTQDDVRALKNAGRYPVVFSFACDTGAYGEPECFAETWLRVPAKGAAAVWASSVSSYWEEDDVLEKRLFDGIYGAGQVYVGEAILYAKQQYLAHYGDTYMTRQYFKMYNLLGDPTLAVPAVPLYVSLPDPMPVGYAGEPYGWSAAAFGGAPPYTNWTAASGSLPVGLTLNAGSGAVSGTPTVVQVATCAVQVADSIGAAATAEAVIPVLDRLSLATTGPLPTGTVGVAYSLAMQAQGGTAPYDWRVTRGEYVELNPGPSWLGGGTAQGWTGDDECWPLSLPWPIWFYGQSYTSLWVSSNGFVDFEGPSTDYENSEAKLAANARIAPLWDDLDLAGTGAGVYVRREDDLVSIRWRGKLFAWGGAGAPVSCELVFLRGGGMAFAYEFAHSDLSPTIGISSGAGEYTLSNLDGQSAIAAGSSRQFAYDGGLPPGLDLSPAGLLSGSPSEGGVFGFRVRVTDTGYLVQEAEREYELTVAAPKARLRFAAAGQDVPETSGTVQATVTRSVVIDKAVTVAYRTVDGEALAGEDYQTAAGTLHFASGVVSRTVSVILIDDPDRERRDERFGIELHDPGEGAVIEGGARHEVTVISEDDVLLEERLTASPGWSTDGDWAYGPPLGGGGEHGSPDPTAGWSGAQVYGFNLAGDYPRDMADTVYLTTPAIDCTWYHGVELGYQRWLGVENGVYDRACVEVSVNGGPWQEIWSNTDSVGDAAWRDIVHDVSGWVDGQPAVSFRWGMGPTDGSVQYCGWNLDDIRLFGREQPSVTIRRPHQGSEFLGSDRISLVGEATTRQGPVATLRWLSDLAGPLGSGPRVDVTGLSVGTHTVTLEAVDAVSMTGRAAVAIHVLADGDGNGLPDDYEATHWPGGGSGGGTNDWDGDGVDNAGEWRSRTNPTNRLSHLRLCGAVQGKGTKWLLEWASEPGLYYNVKSCSNLRDACWQTVVEDVPAEPPTNSCLVDLKSAPGPFFAIELSP